MLRLCNSCLFTCSQRAAGHRPIYPATNDFTGFNVTQPPPFPTLALPPFYFTAYPNQTSSDPASPNYYAAYTGASTARHQFVHVYVVAARG